MPSLEYEGSQKFQAVPKRLALLVLQVVRLTVRVPRSESIKAIR